MHQPLPLPRAPKEHPVLEKCDFLLKTGVWPLNSALHPRQWLENFVGDDEKRVAFELLNRFMYFPKPMTRELLRSAIRKIMPHVLDFTGSPAAAKARWQYVTRRMLFIPVRGEDPSPADSGFHYARLIRDTFDLLDEQLPEFPQILPELLRPYDDGTPNIVVFVDDFVGSGNQFIKTWRRVYEPQKGFDFSCESVARELNTKFFYCPLVATSYGIENIIAACGTSVTLCPAHILSPEYSALHPQSRFWSSDEMRQTGPQILKQIAERVGMPDEAGTEDWRGFHQLGLGLVLNDAMPDACLGVFRFNEHGWRPLFNKAG